MSVQLTIKPAISHLTVDLLKKVIKHLVNIDCLVKIGIKIKLLVYEKTKQNRYKTMSKKENKNTIVMRFYLRNNFFIGPSLSYIRASIASFVMWGSASWSRGSDPAI